MKARDNPYRSEQVLKIRYRFQTGTLGETLARLEQLGFRAAIVGPEGSGKTTLLEDLQEPLAAQGRRLHWFRLTREFPRFSSSRQLRLKQGFTRNDIILFDGAEVLGWFRFQWFRRQTRRAGGLIITTHRPGYLPTLLRTKTSPKLLKEILSTLDPHAAPADVSSLFHRNQGNLREALREMYDVRIDGRRKEERFKGPKL